MGDAVEFGIFERSWVIISLLSVVAALMSCWNVFKCNLLRSGE